MIREWADAVFFANYKVTVINVDNQGAQKGKNKAQGGRRVMYTNHTPFWDAKNRYGLPEEMPFNYDSIRGIIESNVKPIKEDHPVSSPTMPSHVPDPVPATDIPDPISDALKAMEKPKEAVSAAPSKEKGRSVTWEPAPAAKLEEELDKRIPKRLRDLMIASGVHEWDIKNICEAKGYIPYGTELWDYEKINPPLIDSGLIANWDSVVSQIREMFNKEQVPFAQ